MDFRGRVESFEEADRRYAELAQERDAGNISGEEFEEQRQQLMVRDGDGNWWAKPGESGEWRRRDGGRWVKDAPPGHQESGSGPNSPPSRNALSRESADGEKKRRRFPLWIPLAGLVGLALLGMVAVFYVLVPSFQSDEPSGGGQGEQMGVGQGESGTGEQGGEGGGDSDFGAIFVHRATSENISSNSTYIDNSLTNENPDAVLIVTQNWNPGGEGGTYNDHPVGVWYDSGREQWAVFNQDREDMTEEAAFNVAVR